MKNKYLILGDLHCRSIWKDIVDKEGDSCDKIIFLGDYTCPREVKFDDPTDACGFLYEVLDFKDKNPNKVILLRGNHDCQALGYYWAECFPSDHPKVQAYWQTEDVKNWFLKNTQWIYQIPDTNIVCSHAGISQAFLDNVCKYFKYEQEGWDFNIYDENKLINHINDIEPCELFGFTDDNPFDTNGESKTQPCTWIRPYTLLVHGVKDIVHVVGHTPTKHICNIKEQCIEARKIYNIKSNKESVENYCNIWCCDNLANGEYIIIEDGKFKPYKL